MIYKFDSIWLSIFLGSLASIFVYVAIRKVTAKRIWVLPPSILIATALVSPWWVAFCFGVAINAACVWIDEIKQDQATAEYVQSLKMLTMIAWLAASVALYSFHVMDTNIILNSFKKADKETTLEIAHSGPVGQFVADEYLACQNKLALGLTLALGRVPMMVPQSIPMASCREDAIAKAADKGQEFQHQVREEIARVPDKFGEDKGLSKLTEQYKVRWGTFWPTAKT